MKYSLLKIPYYRSHLARYSDSCRIRNKLLGKITDVSAFSSRCLSCDNERSGKSKAYFVSTPIFYVNSVPHIGHLYTSVLADVIARWKRLKGRDVIFATGTDEHGMKIQQAAASRNKSPQQHCDEVSGQFKDLFKSADIEFTDFVRTTEPRHINSVTHFWVFTESGQPVEWIQEDNYMFTLPKLKDELLYWLKQDVIHPSKFATDVTKFVSEELSDLSVSRKASRLHWGIPVPNDPLQTIYVWLDALVNYLTAGGYPSPGYTWPADCHIVGKDILKFHAVYWPAFLLAAGLDPPRQIICHSHWTVDGTKMSKSRGNVVDPVAAVTRYRTDGLRYFLMREGVLHSDGNFNTERLVHLVNSELSNTFGNLLSRCLSRKVNCGWSFPELEGAELRSRGRPEDREMWANLRELPDIVDAHYESFEVARALEAIMSQLRSTNNFMEFHRPWDLAKNPGDAPWLSSVLHVTMETLRVTAILLSPVVPGLSKSVLTRLCAPGRDFDDAKKRFAGGVDLSQSDGGVVFPRLQKN